MRVRRFFTPDEYDKYIKSKMPRSNLAAGIVKAYIIGGAICAAGEAIRTFAMNTGLDEKTAAALTSVLLIAAGAFLTAVGVYDILGKFAGAGSIVPITGFANSIVASAMEYKHEGYVLGVGAKLFTVAGPVLVYGFTASVAAGIWFIAVGG